MHACYTNSDSETLVGLPAKLLNRLQAVINTAACLVCHSVKADHITPVLKDLHWLRIQYKLCVLASKCQHSLAPLVRSTLTSRSNGAHGVWDHRVHQRSSYQLLVVTEWPSVSCRCRRGVEQSYCQSAVNSHCCINPVFIPSSPENSSIHHIFPTILVTFLS